MKGWAWRDYVLQRRTESFSDWSFSVTPTKQRGMIPTSLKLKVCKTFILWDVRHVDVFLCFQTIYVAQTKMCGNKNVITTFQSIDVGRCNCLAEKGAHADCISGSKGFLSLRAECYYETEVDVTWHKRPIPSNQVSLVPSVRKEIRGVPSGHHCWHAGTSCHHW